MSQFFFCGLFKGRETDIYNLSTTLVEIKKNVHALNNSINCSIFFLPSYIWNTWRWPPRWQHFLITISLAQVDDVLLQPGFVWKRVNQCYIFCFVNANRYYWINCFLMLCFSHVRCFLLYFFLLTIKKN